MRTRESSVPIGTSDLCVYPLALGGNVFGWTADESVSHQVLDAFLDAGGNLIDTADVYSAWGPGNVGGESESILGRWLSQSAQRENVVLATKVSQHPDFPGLSATNIAAAAEASLNRLGTDYIDLYYPHFDDEQTPLEEAAAAFDALVRSGKVRYVGLSNYRADRVVAWLRIADEQGFARPIALQPGYNLINRGDYEGELASLATEHQLGVLPYSGLASGFLTGKYRTAADLEGSVRGGAAGRYLTEAGLGVVAVLAEVAAAHDVALATVALAWLRTRPGVVAPIASARTVDQLPALLASATLDLTSAETGALDAASAKVAA